jgi:predicted RND superfamily exporter protein
MIIRLYAMYQRSKKMLIFLIVTFLAVATTSSVMDGVGSRPFTCGKLYFWMND